jgi:tetratricopeptide (TPR) repeat protein
MRTPSSNTKALEQQPGNLPIRMNLALAYYKAAKISQAAGELEAVVAERPGERQPALLLSDCYLRLGEDRKAIDLLTPLQQQTPDDKALDYMLGTALIRDGQTARGELLVDRILRDGDSAEAHLLMGESRLSANDFAGALEEFKKALAINPQLPSLNGYYGTPWPIPATFRAPRRRSARNWPSDPNDYVANFQLGKLLEGDANYAESRRCFERALAVRPHDRAARYQLALLDLEAGQAEQARAALESLVRENPQDVDAHISLATAYYRLKRKQDGNKQRAIVLELNAEKQATAPEGCRNETGPAGAVPRAGCCRGGSGDSACAACHAQETSHFRPTPMAQALETVDQCDILKNHPDLQFQEGPYHTRIKREAIAASSR